MSHTPGPWTMRERNFAFHIYGEFKKSKNAFITAAYWSNPAYGASREEAFQNARLIAAAPELLEALKLCEGNISSLLASAHPKVYGTWLETVRAAIAKATGSV